MKNLPSCFFFVPGLGEKYRSGGLLVIQDVAALVKKEGQYHAEFVATHERNSSILTPDEAFQKARKNGKSIFIVTWGSLAEAHIRLIQAHIPHARILYYAQSFGWNIHIPQGIPIVCVSRFVMTQWAMREPDHLCTYLPPPLDDCFSLSYASRDIDILVHTRKQNEYCLKKLLPALKKESFRIEVIDRWISRREFAGLLQRTKLFLYCTSLHKVGWNRKPVAEGFGLPALEAIACGAVVGSNLIGGVTDFLVPFENCIKLQMADVDFDVYQSRMAVEQFLLREKTSTALAAHYRPVRIAEEWQQLFRNLFGGLLDKKKG